MTNAGYHEVRISHDERRTTLWETLATYFFQQYVGSNDTVLELGAGYCDFINTIRAKRKLALDIWEEIPKYANSDVECVVGDLMEVALLEDSSIDFVFASNIFEHIPTENLSKVLSALRPKLAKNGILCILQPNFKKCYRDYFDDYTHVSIWTDVSLADFLHSHKYNVVLLKPGFLPLSIKSRFPVHPLLIRSYLVSPIKPLAKQMLLMARVAQ